MKFAKYDNFSVHAFTDNEGLLVHNDGTIQTDTMNTRTSDDKLITSDEFYDFVDANCDEITIQFVGQWIKQRHLKQQTDEITGVKFCYDECGFLKINNRDCFSLDDQRQIIASISANLARHGEVTE